MISDILLYSALALICLLFVICAGAGLVGHLCAHEEFDE